MAQLLEKDTVDPDKDRQTHAVAKATIAELTNLTHATTKESFEVLHFIAGKRLAAGKLTIVTSAIVRSADRKP